MKKRFYRLDVKVTTSVADVDKFGATLPPYKLTDEKVLREISIGSVSFKDALAIYRLADHVKQTPAKPISEPKRKARGK